MTSVAVVNTTRNITLAPYARIADNPLTRFVGLLGQRSLAVGCGIVLQDCSAIHTLGMRFAIDALYVDAHGMVVRAVNHLAPWRIGPVEPRADTIIELVAGAIASTQTLVGDHIALTDGGPTP